MKTIKIIYKCLLNLFTLFLIFFAFVSISSYINSSRDKNYVTGLGNYKFLSVLSGSMSPAFNTYDMIIDKVVDSSNIEKGDVITFWSGGALVTHRVTDVNKNEDGLLFTTKGDANNIEDSKEVSSENVIGVYQFRIPYLGLLISKLKGSLGLYILGGLTIFISLTEFHSAIKEYRKKAYKPKHLKKR